MNADQLHRRVTVDLDLLSVLTTHGCLCLALRHPGYQGPSREIAINMVNALSNILVDEGVMTESEMEEATRLELVETMRMRS